MSYYDPTTIYCIEAGCENIGIMAISVVWVHYCIFYNGGNYTLYFYVFVG